MAYQRVEVLTGTERRRTYTSTEKVRMVEEAFRPGVVVTEAARRLGRVADPATSPAILEVILPSGARLRLEGRVDQTLAAAVIGALA
jgi:transposase